MEDNNHIDENQGPNQPNQSPKSSFPISDNSSGYGSASERSSPQFSERLRSSTESNSFIPEKSSHSQPQTNIPEKFSPQLPKKPSPKGFVKAEDVNPSERTNVLTALGTISVPIIGLIIILPWAFLFGMFFGIFIIGGGLFVWLTQPIFQEPHIADFQSNVPSASENPPDSSDKTEDFSNIPMESCKWLNRALSIVLREQFHSATFRSIYQAKIEKEIAKAKKPDFIGEVKLLNVDWGNNVIEIVDGIQMLPPKCEGETRLGCKLKYSGSTPAKATIQVEFWIHFPKKFFTNVFVNLTVVFEYLSGHAMVICPPGLDPQILVGFTSAPTTKLSISSSVGKHNQVRNIPKVTTFILEAIRRGLQRELTIPNGITFRIPIKKERKLKFYLSRKFFTDGPPVNRTTKPPPINRNTKPVTSDQVSESESVISEMESLHPQELYEEFKEQNLLSQSQSPHSPSDLPPEQPRRERTKQGMKQPEQPPRERTQQEIKPPEQPPREKTQQETKPPEQPPREKTQQEIKPPEQPPREKTQEIKPPEQPPREKIQQEIKPPEQPPREKTQQGMKQPEQPPREKIQQGMKQPEQPPRERTQEIKTEMRSIIETFEPISKEEKSNHTLPPLPPKPSKEIPPPINRDSKPPLI